MAEIILAPDGTPLDECYAHGETVLAFGLEPDVVKTLESIARNIGVKIYSTECATDLIAVPCFLSIINPDELAESEIEILLGFWTEMGEADLRVVFTKPLSRLIPAAISAFVTINVGAFSLEMSREQVAMSMLCAEAKVDGHRLRNGALTDDEWSRLTRVLARLSEAPILISDIFTDPDRLKLQILNYRKQLHRKLRVAKEYERRIYRLVRILRTLDRKKYVTSAELAREFKVSARTIQRDISLLDRMGEPIGYDANRKAYYLLSGKSLLWEDD